MSLQIVAEVRAKYPTPLAFFHATFLLDVARALGKGLVHKPNGTHIQLPDGTFVSQDVVMDRSGAAWDILVDGDGVASPAFNGIAPIDPSRYVAVAAQPPVEPPVPPVEPPQPPAQCVCDLTPVLEAIAAVRDVLRRVEDDLDTLVERKPPVYKGRIAGFGVTLRPESE